MKNILAILLALTTAALAQPQAPQVQVTDLNSVYSGARIYPMPLTVSSIVFRGSSGAQNAQHTEQVNYSQSYTTLYGITSRTDRYNWSGTEMTGTPTHLKTLCEIRAGVTTCTDYYWAQASEMPLWNRGTYWERWNYDFMDYSDSMMPVQRRLKYDSYQQLIIPGHAGTWKVRLAVYANHYNPLNMTSTEGIPAQQGLLIAGNERWCNDQGWLEYNIPWTSTPTSRVLKVLSSQSANFTYHISILGVYPR